MVPTVKLWQIFVIWQSSFKWSKDENYVTRGHTRCARDSFSYRQPFGWSLCRTILLHLLRVMLHAIKSGWVYSVTSVQFRAMSHCPSTPAPRLLHALKLIACDGALAFQVSQTVPNNSYLYDTGRSRRLYFSTIEFHRLLEPVINPRSKLRLFSWFLLSFTSSSIE